MLNNLKWNYPKLTSLIKNSCSTVLLWRPPSRFRSLFVTISGFRAPCLSSRFFFFFPGDSDVLYDWFSENWPIGILIGGQSQWNQSIILKTSLNWFIFWFEKKIFSTVPSTNLMGTWCLIICLIVFTIRISDSTVYKNKTLKIFRVGLTVEETRA